MVKYVLIHYSTCTRQQVETLKYVINLHVFANPASVEPIRQQLFDMGAFQQCELTRQQFSEQSPAHEAATHAINSLLYPDQAGQIADIL